MNEAVRLKNILDDYQKVVKPLLTEVEIRCGRIPASCMNEIRALNDHIARCYRENSTSESIDKELSKAEGHNRRLIYDCFKHINVALFKRIERFEKWCYNKRWLELDGGKFWAQYIDNKQKAQKASIEAKNFETLDPEVAMTAYEQAYQHYSYLEAAFLKHRRQMYCYIFSRLFQNINIWLKWAFGTILAAVISTIVTGLLSKI